MKNSRESEWLLELQRRLGSYAEQPDDDLWNRISTQVAPVQEPAWIPWSNRASAGAALVMLSIAGIFLQQPDAVMVSDFASHPHAAYDHTTEQVDVKPAPGFSAVSPIHADVGVTSSAVAHHTPQPDIQINEGVDSWLEQNSITPDTIASDLESKAQDSVVSTPLRKEVAAPAVRRKRRFVFYGSVSGSLAFQKITPLANDGIGIAEFHSRPIFARDRMGFALQGGIQSRIGRRLEVYSGLSVYRQSLKLSYAYISGDVVADRDESFGYEVSPGKVRKSVSYEMLNAGVEAGAMYFLGGDKLLHKLGAGLAWQHGLKRASEGESYDNSRSQYFVYQLFYRGEVALDRKMNVFVQPFYRHVLFSRESLTEPFDVRSFYGGVSIGIVY